jgi:glycosyltransferase involved in cell wall biosynthesis
VHDTDREWDARWWRQVSGVALLAVVAALVAALCYAVAAAVQQHQAAGATSAQAHGWRLLGHLLRQPWWVAGCGAMLAGGGLHLIALRIGPLALVQPIGVCAVIFALPVAAALRRRRPQRGELSAALLIVLGLSGLLRVVPPHVAPALTSIGTALTLVAGAVTVAAVSGGLAAVSQRRGRALLLAISAGVVFGTVSTLIHAVLVGALLLGPLGLATLAGVVIGPLAVAGLLLTQHAYHAGSVAVVLATTTVTDPITAVTAGVVTLRENLPTDPASLLLAGSAAVLMIWGITRLARSPVHQGASPHPPDHELTTRTNHEGHPAMTDDHAPTPAGVDEQPNTRPRLRILIGSDTYPPDVNGASYFTHRLATGMAARGHQVTVVCPAHPQHPRAATQDGVTVHPIPSIRTLVHPTFRICPPPAVGVNTAKVLLQVRPDIIHVQGHFLIGRALIRHARRAGIPVVATNHFMPENLLAYAHIPGWARPAVSTLAWRDFTRVYAQVDHITSPTTTAAQLARSHGLTRAVEAISCGIDLTRFHPRPPGPWPAALARIPRRPSLLYVGRLDEEKHLHELIDALPWIREVTDAQLLLVGTGSQQTHLRRLSRYHGLAEHVHFLGFVPDAELPAIYAAADVFCMPGVAELQSIATLEAMASGLPIVAANALALPHLVHPGVNGYLYQPGDPLALSQHLARLLCTPTLRQDMGRASRTLAASHDIHTTLDHFEALYTTTHGALEGPASVEQAGERAIQACYPPGGHDREQQ